MKWYPTLIVKDKNFKFLKSGRISINSNQLEFLISELSGRITTSRILNQYQYSGNLFKFNIGEEIFIISEGLLGVIKDDQYAILMLEDDNNLFLSKEFQQEYKTIYTKFKKYIQEFYSTDKNIVYCNNPGDLVFEYIGLPKFKSIKDRQEFGQNILQEYYETLN